MNSSELMQMIDVFVSHSTKDKNLCNEIRKLLENSGLSVWDHGEMLAGELLAEQLRGAIKKCHICVFMATPHALESSWCVAEVGAFWGANKPVIIFSEDAGFDEAKLPPQFRGNLRALTRDMLVKAALRALLPKLPRPDRPGVLCAFSHDASDRKKCDALRASFPTEKSQNVIQCSEVEDLSALASEGIAAWKGLLLGFPYGKTLDLEVVNSIVDWVRAGGRLAFTGFELGELHHATNINQLAWHFGIGFNSDVVAKPRSRTEFDKGYDEATVFNAFCDPSHCLFKDLEAITMRNVCSLHLQPGATPLVIAGTNQILNLERDSARYSKRWDGRIVLASGAQKFSPPVADPARAVIALAPSGELVGKGHVLAMGTWDFRPAESETENAQFLGNLWRWLAGRD